MFSEVVNSSRLCVLCPFTLYIFGDQFLRFHMRKEDSQTSNQFQSLNILTIKHYNLSIYKWYHYDFSLYVISNMSTLNLYGYKLKKFDKTYQNVHFLLNWKQIPRSSKKPLGILVFSVLKKCKNQTSFFSNNYKIF